MSGEGEDVGSIRTREDEPDPDWFVEASDEEVYEETGCEKGDLKWKLSSADALVAYGQMESHPDGILPLRYRNPGRRPPTPPDQEYALAGEEDDDASDSAAEEGDSAAAAASGQAADKSMDFDFAEDTPASSLTPRRTPGTGPANRELKGSARKKTTKFSDVIDNVNRFRKIDAANRSGTSNQQQQPPPQN